MFWDLYIAIIYGILYLCFVAYPIVFTGVRGWTAGISGLAFTGLAVGKLLFEAVFCESTRLGFGKQERGCCTLETCCATRTPSLNGNADSKILNLDRVFFGYWYRAIASKNDQLSQERPGDWQSTA